MPDNKTGPMLSRYFYDIPLTCYAAVIMILSSLIIGGEQKIPILIAAAVICGHDVIYGGVKAIIHRHLLSADLLTIIAIAGTFALGLCVEGALEMAVVAAVHSIGEKEFEFENGRHEFKYDKIYDDGMRRKLNEMEHEPSRIENGVKIGAVVFPAAVIAAAIILSIVVPLVWRIGMKAWLRRAFVLISAAGLPYPELCTSVEFSRVIDDCCVNGIFFKNRKAIEMTSKITSIVLSRTESEAASQYEITEIIPCGISKNELLTMACYACAFSDNDISRSLTSGTGITVDPGKVDMYKNFPQMGSAVIVGGVKIAAGSEKLLDALGIVYDKQKYPGIYIYVCAEKKYAGCVKLSERAEPVDSDAIKAVHECGIDRVVLISEENDVRTDIVGQKLGVDEVWPDIPCGRLPDKMQSLESMQLESEVMAYVGNSMTESAIMNRADIGIVLGSSRMYGDIYIDDGNSIKISYTIRRARTMMRNIRRNLTAASVLKAVAIILAVLGLSGIWLSSLLDLITEAYILREKDNQK